MTSKNWTLNIVTCLIILLIFEVSAKKDFELTFLNFTCSVPEFENKSKALISAFQCGLSKNAKRRTLNFEITFVKDIPQFDINIVFVLPRRSGNFVLLNLTKLSFCNLMANKNQVPLMNLGRQILDHYSNLPKQCPMRGNVLYYVRGYRVDISKFPAISFESDMNIKLEYVIEKSVQFRGYLQSHIGLRAVGKV